VQAVRGIDLLLERTIETGYALIARSRGRASVIEFARSIRPARRISGRLYVLVDARGFLALVRVPY
jgi:hypothetical protein